MNIKAANLIGSVSRRAGGLYESVRRLMQALQISGIEVGVFGCSDKYTEVDAPAWAPVKVSTFPPRGLWQFGYSPKLIPALAAYEPDLIHTHGLWMYASVATNHYCRRRRVPYIISPHGMLDPWAIRNSRWKKMVAYCLYEKAHLHEAACLRALCASEARSMRQLGLKNPIAIIPNGIDMPAKHSRCQAENGIPPWAEFVSSGQKVLLFLSRIHPKKGLVNLLRAWAAVQRPAGKSQWSAGGGRAPDWILAIAGWDQGGHEEELKRLCTELQTPWVDVRSQTAGLRGNEVAQPRPQVSGSPSVVFLGPQFNEAKAVCYAHCDAFILPSFSEGVPMVVLEAWAYGKPVVMTPECNLPLGFARNAAIRIETSVEGITRGLGELFQAPPAARQILGNNGLVLVRDQFAWPVIGQEMAQLYLWILGHGNKPACITDY